MPYYGGGGTSGSGGTNDHRLLAGRSDANQHPASAVAVAPIPAIGTEPGTVQQALEALADRGAEEITPVAAVAVGAFKAVAFRADGRIEPASHDNPAHCSRLAGVTLAAVAAGATARVSVNGLVRSGGWTWTPGAPVFVGANGDLTQTAPATGFAQPIGTAVAVDAIQVRIGQAVRRDG